MEDNYLYKTRVSLINLDVLLSLIITVLGFLIDIWLGLAFFALLFIWVSSIISMRMYVYDDRIEYRVGFVLKTSSKTLLLKDISSISYSSNVIGKVFNYGDIIIVAYNGRDGFQIKGMKNAKMLAENIKALISEKEK